MACFHGGATFPHFREPPRLIQPSKSLSYSVVALLLFCSTAKPQNTQNQFSPEINAYVHVNESLRVLLLAAADDDQLSQQEDFGTYFEVALKPVFRRQLRENDNVFIKRFLSFRAGYRYLRTFAASPSVEHRWIAEMTSRFPLPKSFQLIDHNIGEFRIINNKPFSIRYRNGLQLERDFRTHGFVFTPYVNGELDYDTRYASWYRDRYAVGVQVPAGRHLVFETYVMHQNQSHGANPPHLNRVGVTASFFLGRIRPK